jgi:hypothetical protein
VYTDHLEQVVRFLTSRRCFRRLPGAYHDVLYDPEGQARQIGEFLDRRLDVAQMAAVVDRRGARALG